MRRTRLLCAAAVACAFALGACSDDGGDETTADPAEFAAQELEDVVTRGTPTPSTTTTTASGLAPTDVPGAPIDPYDLDVGDCFEQLEDLVDDRAKTITTQLGCDEPHRFEIFHRFTYPAEHPSVYPGESAMRDYAVQVCYRRFEDWVGAEYELSALEIDVIIPTQDNFEHDVARYRGMHCSVERADGEPMVGTSRGSGW